MGPILAGGDTGTADCSGRLRAFYQGRRRGLSFAGQTPGLEACFGGGGEEDNRGFSVRLALCGRREETDKCTD